MGLLEILAAFDLITPVRALAKDIATGDVRVFRMSTNAGMSARKVEKFLKKKGVSCWGFMNVPGRNAIRFSVPAAHAVKARRLLNKKGIPLQG